MKVKTLSARAAATLATVLAACERAPSPMRPASEPAEQLALLGWVLIVIATIVCVVIAILLLIPSLRGRRGSAPMNGDAIRRGDGERWILIGGAFVPALILIGVYLFTLSTLSATASPPTRPRLTVLVTGHQWWWEVHYANADPSQVVTTANEIHIPVGEPIAIKVDSRDVAHSFWVPRLQGKIDLIPGQTNTFWIRADRPGVYRGQCAEYCGTQHAHMAMQVVAQPAPAFEAWLRHQREPAADPVDTIQRAGRAVFRAACSVCHTIQGTGTGGRMGPDLTHVAGRLMLAAGTIPNTRGHLAGWIANAQTIKPGNAMPQIYLDGESLQALVAYLESLR